MKMSDNAKNFKRLYNVFGSPSIKELGALHGEINAEYSFIGYESEGEIYEKKIDDLPDVFTERQNNLPEGKGFIAFTRKELKKLLEINVGAIEIVITNDDRILVIIHHFYEKLD